VGKTGAMSYFERLGPHRFRATEHVSGAWRLDEQHIAPALGLLAHLVELDHLERRPGSPLTMTRLSFDILGTMAVDEVATCVAVLRAGRTIELVEARMSQAGRDAVILRAWLQGPTDTSAIAGTHHSPMPGPDDFQLWPPEEIWPGGFIASVQVHRDSHSPGRARFWVRTDQPLVDNEPVSDLARAVGLLDIANGMAVRADPTKVAFPNLDLTAHFFRSPGPGWLGFDTSVTFGDSGVGLTSSVIHDEQGPVGTLNQILTVRP